MQFPNIEAAFETGADISRLEREVWQYQLANNPVIRDFCSHLGTQEQTFIPIQFFKQFELKTGSGWEPEVIFESSGTTGAQTSHHLVRDAALYERSLLEGFRHFYGPGEFRILALLPNYLEKGGSSLVFMVKTWMDQFGTEGSGFYLYDHEELKTSIEEGIEKGEKLLIIGVSFALLDFAEKFSLNLPQDAIVMETGGMKGRRKELTREELHAALSAGFGVKNIHSEYGMTELLSQAYAVEPGRFRCPPWMSVTITDLWLPDRVLQPGQTGRINITDLMNIHSCAFIRTDDMGKIHPDGSFEVLGRADVSDMRGCNLLYEST